jgi:hypothetical protein
MIFGTDEIPEYVQQYGFNVTNNLKILGFNISKNSEELSENFVPVINKIKNVARFWERFKLSIAGRINVAKTLMLSQISYIGSIIQPTELQLQEMQETINKFISGPMRIGLQNVSLNIAKGGLGMINIKEFIISLQCSWVKRAQSSQIDNWRTSLAKISGNNVLTTTPIGIDKNERPILYNISKSFYQFKECFYKINDNFLASYVMGNPLLINNSREKIKVGNDYILGCFAAPDPDPEQIANLKIHNFFTAEGDFLSRQDTNDILGLNFTVQGYQNIRECILDSNRVLQKVKTVSYDNTTVCIENFVKKFKKGSKTFRRTLETVRIGKIKCKTKSTVKTFFRLVDIPVPEEKVLEALNRQWSTHFLPVKVRDFIFKFRNNILGLNTRVSHFNQEVNRGCTFCSAKNIVPVPDESFYHLFFDCESVSVVFNSFFQQYMYDCNLLTHESKKKFLFLGYNPRTEKLDNVFLTVLAIMMTYFVWECKLQKKVPTFMNLCNSIFYKLENTRRASSSVRESMNNDLHICRIWTAEASARR